jgi:hypothetical protein
MLITPLCSNIQHITAIAIIQTIKCFHFDPAAGSCFFRWVIAALFAVLFTKNHGSVANGISLEMVMSNG